MNGGFLVFVSVSAVAVSIAVSIAISATVGFKASKQYIAASLSVFSCLSFSLLLALHSHFNLASSNWHRKLL